MRKATLLISLASLVVSAFGQTVSSSLVGTVLDQTGAAIPTAPVTLTEQDTGTVREILTDTVGVFRFLNLTPGNYSITVHQTGFKTLLQSNISLSAQETRDVGKLSLELGNSSEKITVIAEATPV